MSEKAKWEKLNAHVDGELDADDAVEIADAAANDPAVAHDLVALTHVKAALADSIDAPDLEIPRGGVTGEKTYWLRNVAAAVTVLAVGAAALFHIVSSNMGSTSGTQWIATAHNEWVVATERKDTMAMPRTVGSSVPELERVYIPDLSSARLRVAHIGQPPNDGQRGALIVGYRGTRGCTVTLAISRRTDGLSDKLAPVTVGGMRGFAWRTGDIAFYVIAHGMAETRLKGVAEGIRETNIRYLPLRPETSLALAKNRAESPPCRV